MLCLLCKNPNASCSWEAALPQLPCSPASFAITPQGVLWGYVQAHRTQRAGEIERGHLRGPCGARLRLGKNRCWIVDSVRGVSGAEGRAMRPRGAGPR